MGLVKAFKETPPGAIIVYRITGLHVVIEPVRPSDSTRVGANVHVWSADPNMPARLGQGEYEWIDDDWIAAREQRLITAGVDPDNWENA
jgi:hypothetical protein